ncbi:unnamed protein product [Cylindrotheca closterium]|uniref:WW domain-containing protein n=1 Tax=Cylindrotheca closterium TaxID=2856 RepID=A0AAD2CSL9_9STRA|nr:unnamed protein product [Cylindrotheca closterium]
MGNANSTFDDAGFPGSSILESLNPCGDLSNTELSPKGENRAVLDEKLFDESEYQGFAKNVEERDESPTLGPQSQPKRASVMFAKALVNEVTNNPNTMRPADMAERERRLMKAQLKANKRSVNGDSSKIVGIPGGVGQPSIFGSIAHALTGDADPLPNIAETRASLFPPNSTMSQNRAQIEDTLPEPIQGEHSITIGLCLSRRSSVGNEGTITRQTAFDFNELQDREYNYVSSTDSNGWRAGGGEPGGSPMVSTAGEERSISSASGAASHKVAAPDVVHIPIIQIDAESAEAIDHIIAVLASGDIFIPHMSIIPEALSVEGVSPPNIVVRFGTERNEDFPPDQWSNWCLEFMHNQLFEYFQDKGAVWGKRPFSITLAKEVRWKTVKHMNKYFAHAERVIDAWREKGPQFLDPQLAYANDSSTPEEVSQPHGIYLFRKGIPTNYFAPNFAPPYTTNMTRNLLLNVLNKSWDAKRREWTSQPNPRIVTPTMLFSAMLGCSDNMAGGFLANEVTISSNTANLSILPDSSSIRSARSAGRSATATAKIAGRPPTPRKKQSPSPKVVVEEPRDEKCVIDSLEADSRQQVDALLSEDDSVQEKTEDETPSEYTSFNDELDLMVIGGIANATKKSLDEILMDSPTGNAVSIAPVQMHRQLSHNTDATDKQTNLSSIQQELMQALNDQEKANDNEEALNDQGKANDNAENAGPQLVSDDDWFDDMGHPIQTPSAAHERPPIVLTASSGAESAASYSIVFEDQSGDMSDSARVVERTVVEQQVDKVPGEKMLKIFKPTMPVYEQQKAPTPIVDRVMVPEFEMRQDTTQEHEETSGRDPPSSGERDQHPTDRENYYPLHQLYGKQQMDLPLTPGRKNHPEVLRNNSAVSALSMEYSLDSTNVGDGKSLYTHQSSLLGQHLSEPTRPVHIQTKSLLTTVTKEARSEEVVPTDSEDSTEIVPSDEELFNVGWAKALDPNSGSYYFFTLDRSKIVWENPLASGTLHTRPSMDTAGSSILI